MSLRVNRVIEKQVITYVVQNQDIRLLEIKGLSLDLLSKESKEIVSYIIEMYSLYDEVPSEATIVGRFPDTYDNVKVTDTYLTLEELFITHLATLEFATHYSPIMENIVQGTPYDKKKALKDMSALTEDIAERINLSNTDNTSSDYRDGQSRLEAYRKKKSSPRDLGFKLGIEKLDKALVQILSDDLVVIGARPAMGKSYISTYFASKIFDQGKNVYIYAGEMTKEQVMNRLDTIRTGISNRALQFGNAPIDEVKYENYLKDMETRHNKIIVETQSKFDGVPTVGELLRDVRKQGVDVVVIDQLSLLRPNIQTRDERTNVKNIMKYIHEWITLNKIPVIVLSQVNRESQKDQEKDAELVVPDTRHLAEADAIGQFATRVVNLVSRKLEENKGISELKLGIKKNRFGDLSETGITIDFDSGRIIEDIQAPVLSAGTIIQEEGKEVTEVIPTLQPNAIQF